MNIKKSLIALAVASSIAPFAAQAADVTISGVVQTKMHLIDDSAADEPVIAAGDVRINLNAQDTRGGITGYGNYRVDADGLSQTGLTADSIYVGLKGGFGDIRLGEVEAVNNWGELANDLYNFNADSEAHLSYQTPDLGGFKAVLTYSPEANIDQLGLGLQYNGGGLTVGLGYDDFDQNGNAADVTEGGFIVGAKYNFGPGYVAAHYGDRDDFSVTSVKGGISAGTWSFDATYTMAENGAGDLPDKYQINADTSITDALGLNLRYQETEDADDAIFRVQLGYSF